MHHYRAKRIIKAKYRETRVINYRQDNDNFNTLQTCTFLDCDEYRMDYDGQIDTTRCKHAVGIQYKHESKEDITGFISKPVARPDFPNCDNYGSLLANNPDPMSDDTPTNDNKLHQVICNNFKIDYF